MRLDRVVGRRGGGWSGKRSIKRATGSPCACQEADLCGHEVKSLFWKNCRGEYPFLSFFLSFILSFFFAVGSCGRRI